MTTPALVEEQRTTLYRRRLAALLRRPTCQSICFAVGTAPVHRGFFHDTAVAIEGRQTGDVPQHDGVSHRQVRYGVRIKIGACEAGRAAYDAERAILAVADERDLDMLAGQAALVGACVHFGLDIAGRHLQPLDNECAARIAAYLYQLFETLADADGEAEVMEKLQADESDRGGADFRAAAMAVFHHHRATCRANLRPNRPLEPGSFMRIIRLDERARLHRLLTPTATRANRRPPRPREVTGARKARFLVLQLIAPVAVPALAAWGLRHSWEQTAPHARLRQGTGADASR